MQSIKRVLLLLGALIPAVLAAPVESTRNAEVVPGKYIITFKEGVTETQVAAHTTWATDLHKRNLARRDPNSADLPAGIEKKYSISTFNAYAGSFDDATIESIRNNEDVSIPSLE